MLIGHDKTLISTPNDNNRVFFLTDMYCLVSLTMVPTSSLTKLMLKSLMQGSLIRFTGG